MAIDNVCFLPCDGPDKGLSSLGGRWSLPFTGVWGPWMEGVQLSAIQNLVDLWPGGRQLLPEGQSGRLREKVRFELSLKELVGQDYTVALQQQQFSSLPPLCLRHNTSCLEALKLGNHGPSWKTGDHRKSQFGLWKFWQERGPEAVSRGSWGW